jgi:hypothetical protein
MPGPAVFTPLRPAEMRLAGRVGRVVGCSSSCTGYAGGYGRPSVACEALAASRARAAPTSTNPWGFQRGTPRRWCPRYEPQERHRNGDARAPPRLNDAVVVVVGLAGRVVIGLLRGTVLVSTVPRGMMPHPPRRGGRGSTDGQATARSTVRLQSFRPNAAVPLVFSLTRIVCRPGRTLIERSMAGLWSPLESLASNT